MLVSLYTIESIGHASFCIWINTLYFAFCTCKKKRRGGWQKEDSALDQSFIGRTSSGGLSLPASHLDDGYSHTFLAGGHLPAWPGGVRPTWVWCQKAVKEGSWGGSAA